MTFYIAESIDEISPQDYGTEISDELFEFICRQQRKAEFDMSNLTALDPYGDTEVPLLDLDEIIETCRCILEQDLLQSYDDPDEGEQMLQDLISIAQTAKAQNSGLFSMGD